MFWIRMGWNLYQYLVVQDGMIIDIYILYRSDSSFYSIIYEIVVLSFWLAIFKLNMSLVQVGFGSQFVIDNLVFWFVFLLWVIEILYGLAMLDNAILMRI